MLYEASTKRSVEQSRKLDDISNVAYNSRYNLSTVDNDSVVEKQTLRLMI